MNSYSESQVESRRGYNEDKLLQDSYIRKLVKDNPDMSPTELLKHIQEGNSSSPESNNRYFWFKWITIEITLIKSLCFNKCIGSALRAEASLLRQSLLLAERALSGCWRVWLINAYLYWHLFGQFLIP